ncbi:uncharacterized protein LOC121292298 [Carcharodon carcharias]|uniref:uncharacterized protein LOC121292298 n=1 Tax=Carcharodon carcharias TaxID=13397 RepID=UPI001B7E2500|nr:uncharacterized protein LOC121292298 [Carcharodon carcharias]
MDDVMIHESTQAEHEMRVKAVLRRGRIDIQQWSSGLQCEFRSEASNRSQKSGATEQGTPRTKHPEDQQQDEKALVPTTERRTSYGRLEKAPQCLAAQEKYCLPEEMQRSRLPIYQPWRAHTAVPPLEAPIAKMFRTGKILQPSLRNHPVNLKLPEFDKDLPQAFNFSQKVSSAVTFEATSKPSKVALNKRKKMPPLSRMTRADMEKYMVLKVVEAELRDQNQLLEVAQQQLKQELKMAKDQTNKLMVESESLQSEKEAMSKRLQNCIIILESNLIDPVSANKIIEDRELKNACQRDTVVHVENLQAELETWGKYTADKREKLQEMRLKLHNTKEESNKIVEETDLILKELEEWRITLNQSKQLLD